MSQRCLKGVSGCLKGVLSEFQVYRVYISFVFLGSIILKGVSTVFKIISEVSRKGGAASELYYTSQDYQINISQHGRDQ